VIDKRRTRRRLAAVSIEHPPTGSAFKAAVSPGSSGRFASEVAPVRSSLHVRRVVAVCSIDLES
jgi:hypothetical protein